MMSHVPTLNDFVSRGLVKLGTRIINIGNVVSVSVFNATPKTHPGLDFFVKKYGESFGRDVSLRWTPDHTIVKMSNGDEFKFFDDEDIEARKFFGLPESP